MSKKYKLFSHFLSVLILGSFGSYIILNFNELIEKIEISYTYFAGIIIASIVNLVLQTYIASLMLESIHQKANFRKLFAIQSATVALNYLPLKFGTILRGKAFKQLVGLPYSSFFGFLLLQSVLYLFAGCIVTLIALITIKDLPLSTLNPILLVTSLIILVLILSLTIPLPGFENKNNLPARLYKNVLTVRKKLVKQPPAISLKLTIAAVTIVFISALRTYFAFLCVDQPIPASGAVVSSASGILVNLLSITPSGLGLREQVYGSLTFIIGSSFAAGVLGGIVERLFTMIGFFLLAIFTIPWTLRFIGEKKSS